MTVPEGGVTVMGWSLGDYYTGVTSANITSRPDLLEWWKEGDRRGDFPGGRIMVR